MDHCQSTAHTTKVRDAVNNESIVTYAVSASTEEPAAAEQDHSFLPERPLSRADRKSIMEVCVSFFL